MLHEADHNPPLLREVITMNKEINLHRLRLVIRGALDYLNRDGGDINEALTAQGKVKLTVTMESIETALLWLRRMVEDALNDEEK